MRRSRLSIAGLMGSVLIAALGVAAMRSGTERWANAFTTITLVVLGYAALAASLTRGERGAAWRGCALFGCGYWMLTLSPWWGASFRTQLATSDLLRDARTFFASRGLGPMTLTEAVVREFRADPEVVRLAQEIEGARARARAAQEGMASDKSGDLLAVKAATDVYLLETEYQTVWEKKRGLLTQNLAPSFAASPLLIEPFERVGHALIALGAGAAGAWAGRRAARSIDRRDRDRGVGLTGP